MVTELIPGLYMFVLIHAAVPGARVSGVFPLLVLGLSMFSSNACLLRVTVVQPAAFHLCGVGFYIAFYSTSHLQMELRYCRS